MQHAPPFVPRTERRCGYGPAERVISCAPNISQTERLISAVSGAGILLNAMLGPRKTRPLSWLSGGALLYRGLSGHCVGYAALGISTADQPRNEATAVPARQGVKLETSIAIQRRPADLYAFWRNVENLPKVMRHLAKVVSTGPDRSHWVACGPLNRQVEWEAELFQEEQNSYIAWRSLPGGDVETAGSVHFRPLGRSGEGCVLKLSLKYNPPGGKLAARVAELLGVGVESGIEADLRRFKTLMESNGDRAGVSPPAGAHN